MSIGKSGKGTCYGFLRTIGMGSDVGCRRSVNEDSIGIADNTPNGSVVVICDGMGGNVGGKVASKTAVDAVLTHLKEHQYDDPKDAIDSAIREANRWVLKSAELHPELAGMGCTCVLLIVSESGDVNIGHVGDSRIYRLSKGRPIQRLTKDQSYVQMLVDEGTITPQEAERHPRNNEITNAVGMRGMTPPVIGHAINPVAGDCFLLCSDGLSKLVSEEDIARIAGDRTRGTQERVDMLIEAAKNNGGSDNISVILVEFAVNPNEAKKDRENKRLRVVIYALTGIILLAVLSFFLIGTRKKDNTAPPTAENHLDSSDSTGGINPGPVNHQDPSLPPMVGFGNEEVNADSSPDSGSGKSKETDDKEPEVEPESSEAALDDQGNKEDNGDDISKKTFAAAESTFKVKAPIGKRYSEDCVIRNENDDRDKNVKIVVTPDGGLKISKTGEVDSWNGYYIKIVKYLDKDGRVQEAEKPITIEFE